MPGGGPKRVATFREEWLLKDDFKNWLKQHDSSNTHAVCGICRSDIFIGSIGIGAIESHRKGKKHIERLVRRSNPSVLGYFPNPSLSSTTSPSTSQSQVREKYILIFF